MSPKINTIFRRDTLFSETLRYASTQKPGTDARWDGNIAEASFTNTDGSHTYAYTYDGIGRLTDAKHYAGASNTATNARTERNFSYDRNGNITALTRYDEAGTGTPLSFAFTGNRIAADTYDAMGNLTRNSRNGLEFSYNLANLPESVEGADGASLTYSYLSDGSKWCASANSGPSILYRGSFVYEDDGHNPSRISSIAWDEGRISYHYASAIDSLAVVDSLEVELGEIVVVDTMAVDIVEDGICDEWHVRDHLGSVRAIAGIGNYITGVRELNTYLSFGTRIPGSIQAADNRHRFGGKEEQRYGTFNIGLSDFGARYYDPFTCRWTTRDPMAGKYLSLSPYNYCAENPVNLVDPKGKDIYIFDEEGHLVRIEEKIGINRLAVTSKDGNGNTHIQFYYFADLVNDPKDIDKGIITNIMFVDDTTISSLLSDQSVFDTTDGILDFVKSSNSFEIGDMPRYDYTASTLFNKYGGFIEGQETKSKYLFIVKGERFAHNLMNFGNYLWSATGYTYGVPILGLMLGAQANSLGFFANNNYNPQLDSLDDQLSIFMGARHAAKNNYRNKRQKK